MFPKVRHPGKDIPLWRDSLIRDPGSYLYRFRIRLLRAFTGMTMVGMLGNFLITLSIVGLIYTFWPILKDEWEFRFGRPELHTISSEFSLAIPRLKIYAPIIADIDPLNPREYTQALTRGVAQAMGSVTPDKPGMTYLFAHSSEAPWLMTRQNSAFYRLPKILVGDEIIIMYLGKEYVYTVSEKKIVWPTELDYLKQTGKDQLILQTCYPVGTDIKRLLVIAEPV